MKFIVLILLTSTLGYTQDQDIGAIQKIFAKQQAAWNHGDLEGFMEGYWKSDSLKFIGKRGVNYGWKATLESYKKGYPNKEAMGELTFTILSYEKLSSTSIFIIGKYQLKRTNDSPSGYFTLLWKKINGEWVIVADHSS